MKRALAWLAGCLVVPSTVLAVTTKSFVIDGMEALEKGKFEGTAAHSSGKLTRTVRTDRVGIEGVPVAYASAVGPDGAIYVGTGNDGAIYRVTGEGAKLFADTDAALITSLVWADGTLFAGSLPGGRVFAVDAAGKVQERARLPDAEHVWALAFDAKQQKLYAGTGPQGKLFAIDRTGASKLVHDDVAEHILSLDLDAEGRVYAGTSHGARLVRIADGNASVLYDFPGQEITALDVGAHYIAVAANEFPDPPPPGGDQGKEGPPRLRRPKPGRGKVFTLGFDGRVREWLDSDAAHVSALEIEPGEHALQIGLAQEGRVVRVSESGERVLWADADERQVVALHLQGKQAHFVTSDGVAVYRVREAAREGTWTSAVLDTKVPSRFGELSFRARGDLRWATRTGNTETPDESWSAWSKEGSTAAPIRSPSARFLQVRITLSGDAELYDLNAYYLPQNQGARVRNVRVRPPKPADPKQAPGAQPHKSALPLTWDVDNPDEDRLRYRIHYRNEAHAGWLPVLRQDELLEQNEYEWETRSLPDGYYRVRVEASDEASNPDPFVERTEALSAPVLVDNHAPEVLELKLQGKLLAGRARDSLGPIEALELSLDGAPFRPIFPDDGLLDTRDESFRFDLGGLAPGTHILSVRASDAAHNVSSNALEFQVGG
jgi:outer membrane protein assembly factor BamB